MALYKTPGVYIEEISTLPPSVAEVATAVPAFIGYTANGPDDTLDPLVVRIETMLDYITTFGGPQPAKFTVTAPAIAGGDASLAMVAPTSAFMQYYALSHYFKNGGGPCYVVSVGNYKSTPKKARFSAGLSALEKEDEPTLLLFTDAVSLLSATDYYALAGEALGQCKKLGDRFTILDVHSGDVTAFRNDSNLSANLSYGAAYHPFLQTSMAWEYADKDIDISRGAPKNVTGTLPLGGANGIVVRYTGLPASAPMVAVTFGAANAVLSFTIASNTLTIIGANGKTGADVITAWGTYKGANASAGFDISKGGDGTAAIAAADVAKTAVPLPVAVPDTLATIRATETSLYNKASVLLDSQYLVLPPSAAIAGIYARVDREQGVWKAPGNVGVLATIGPMKKITNDEQDNLNIDATAGKSINAIRAFTGKGTLVWGARTLAGNDNEWRYVSVRRLFIMVEESARKATGFAVFESNDSNTWLKVKAMIESYLYGLWERGALAGSKPEAAYFVHVGLGSTMTPQDVLEGRMNVDIGIAAVRPAEFIVLRFSHKLQTD
jgi:phage tail sheath protein FI